MSVVNADANELLQSWNNIKIAITSIETTKTSMTRKYQQLSSEWNDKKYKELGDVVQDCNRALNEVLKTLSKGEKFISSLAKSLEEYDNVNLGGSMSGDNAFVQSLRSATNSTGGTSQYQYCLGVLTRGNIPEGYLNVIAARHQNGETGVRRVFDHFTNQMLIQDANYPANQTAHYSPISYEGHQRGVYYNATSDMSNPRGAGTTYFHELAHMIDHASTGYQGNLSNTPEFGNALVQDGQRILQLFNNMPPERQNAFLNRIRSDSAHSFSDLIDATTNGQLSGSYGHSREYWNRSGNLQAEAFAHFFEASMGSEDKLEMLSNFFPTAFGVFSTLIESIQPDQYVRVLERRR